VEAQPAKKAPVAAAATAKTVKSVEREKARASARSFVVSAGATGVEEAKRKHLADLVKYVAAPRLTGDILF